MDKKLRDLAWSVLPKEFKEEVKRLYKAITEKRVNNSPTERYFDGGYEYALKKLFGRHNLTSDAEGEVELLHVTRQKVMGLYANAKKLHDLYTSATCINEAESRTIDRTDGTMSVLKTLFGSKCLPDNVDSSEPNVDSSHDNVDSSRSNVESLEPNSDGLNEDNFAKSEPKPAGPKESPRQFYRIIGTDEHGRQVVTPIPPEVAGPYDISEERTEPGEDTSPNVNNSDIEELVAKGYVPDPAKMVDNIIRDGFSKERRLNIATQMASAYISSEGMTDPSLIATIAFQLADALIAECEKGGGK